MVKVKLVKLTDEMLEYCGDYEKSQVGRTFEAFEIYIERNEEKYKYQYALNMKDHIWFVPMEICEVVERFGEATQLVNAQSQQVTLKPTNRILLVEDGSVDIDHIEEDLGIDCIIYRSGANKPEWL